MIRFWRKRLEKGSVQRPLYPLRINLRFVVEPKVLREEYIALLDRMIKRVEQIINAPAKTVDTKNRLRAMEVLTKLIQATYTLIRDVEIEQLEREIEELEGEKGEA